MNKLETITNIGELVGKSIVRRNLISEKDYRPYCGNNISRNDVDGCYNPRTEYRTVDGQFICPNCKWISQLPQDFVDAYKHTHNL